MYPIWVVAGWDNYGGHLTTADFAGMNVHDPSGFLSVFKKAVEAGPQAERWQLKIADRLAEVRDKMLDLGPDALCMAISSQ
jgi:hypothetical protein